MAVTMVVLPLIYLGLMALSAGGLWRHLTSHAWIVAVGGNVLWNLLFYLTPALAGVGVPVSVRPGA